MRLMRRNTQLGQSASHVLRLYLIRSKWLHYVIAPLLVMAGTYGKIDGGSGSEGGEFTSAMSDMGTTFIEGSWPADMNMIPPIVNGLMYYSQAPSRDVFIKAFEAHCWPNYRFNSHAEAGRWVRRHEKMDCDYHFIEESMADEAAIDAYIQKAMMEPLDIENYPPWRLIILRSRPPSRSAIFFRLHHCISDGMGLLFGFSPIMGCKDGRDPLLTIPMPGTMLPPAQQAMKAEQDKAKGKKKTQEGGACRKLCSYCCAPCVFCKGCCVALTATHDSELAINPALDKRTPYILFNGQRVFKAFPPISMDIVKEITHKTGTSVNDVLMAALTGAMRRYGAEVAGDPKLQDGVKEKLSFNTMFMIALPRPIKDGDMMTALTNKALFASCPLPIDEATAGGRLKRTTDAFSNLKSTPYVAGLNCLTSALQTMMPKTALRKAVSETFSKHSLLCTDVPGPTVPVVFPKDGGETLGEVHMVFPNIISQVSLISYGGFVYGNIVSDPGLIAEPAKLGQFWAEEFAMLRDAGVE
eukprot:TRINITY_DN32901_c0_g2_i1.p1 TRINITY_DN32901_c0_g2~~TRINITY_DN32901_c0_g2_i1.p1  ORF type:complete len:525 (+),score=58.43 TRINITY_DN32901_c0_g2_i1:180-1754(+)